MALGGVLDLLKRNTIWLYTAEILPRIVGLFVVPIWSARVAPEEYARWILALTSTEILLQVGGLGFESFLTKVLYRYHDTRAQRYFGMGGTLTLGFTAVCACGMAAFSPSLSRSIIGNSARTDLFAVLGVYILAAQFTNLAILYLGSRVQYSAYFVVVMSRWFFNLALLLIFLLIYKQGFYSWVWAAVGAELLLLPITVYQLREVRWRWWGRHMLRFAFRFSLPSLATNALSWGQSRVGRYVVSFAGMGAGLGLYGVAQNFAQNYGGVVRPTKIVALRILGHSLEADADSPYYLEFFHGFACVALSVAFLVALFLGDVMKLFIVPAYYGATVAVPSLVFTLYLQEVYSLYHSLMFRYFKVWFHLWATIIGFPTVMAATLILVPIYGFLGAAFAQLMGALAMVIFAHRYATGVSQRDFRFGEKAAFTLGAFVLAGLAEALALPLFPRMILAVGALTPYLLFHWRRRTELFPIATGVTDTEALASTSAALSRPT